VIEVTSLTPTTLYYYCSVHSGMGGTITVSS
jgi:plastocyanin